MVPIDLEGSLQLWHQYRNAVRNMLLSTPMMTQRWEETEVGNFYNQKEALKRKAAVENEINNGTFIPPSELTVKDFLRDFVELYGTKRWGLSVYASNNGLISNYINPLIGDEIVQDINRRSVDQFIQKLQKTPPIETPYRHARTDFVTPCTIEKIIKLMRCAFHQAVRWDIIGKIRSRMQSCPSGRKGQSHLDCRYYSRCSQPLLGWKAVCRNQPGLCLLHADGRNHRPYMGLCSYIRWRNRSGWCLRLDWKELARVDQKAINAVGEKDILFVFPRLMGGKSSTRLVLKKPKTESSIRKVWIPRTLAFILREWKEKQDKLKEFMGDDYIDYNLVLAQETGRPCEDRIIGNQFERLKNPLVFQMLFSFSPSLQHNL